jgi:opacity protein-like surface antigen
MMKRQVLLLSAAIAALSTTARADYWHDSNSGAATDGYAAPQAAAAPTAPAPGGWTGGYVGINLGLGSSQASYSGYSAYLSDFTEFGIYGGYLYDLGEAVIGGELSYDHVSFDVGDTGGLTSLKGRLGYDGGKIMPYVALGWANIQATDLNTNGAMFGLGMDYKISEQFLLGAEYDAYEFPDVLTSYGISGASIEAGSLVLRLTVKF